ncbi:MAG: ribokinase [Gammaproteobacteria bacterium]
MQDVVVVGSFVQDFAFSTQAFPAPGETRIGLFATGPGGKGFNQAVAANRQGVATLFIGAVGDDMFAEKARVFAREEQLECGFETIDSQPSGAASIVINAQAENLIVVALGANDALSTEHIDSFTAQIRHAKVVVSQLENNITATVRAFEIARAANVITLLNPAPINESLSVEVLRHVDILTPNETEFAFLCKHLFGIELAAEYWLEDSANLHETCRKLNVPIVVITLGAHGAFVSMSDDAAQSALTEHFFSVPPAKVNPIDTTGAGDAFNGGLAAALAEHGTQAIIDACTKASRVGGLSTEKPGTAPAMPTRAQIAARFASS